LSDQTGRTSYWKRLESWFLAASFLILVVTSFSAWQNARQFSTVRAHGRFARDAADNLEEIVVSVREAEASQRGYLLTGNDSDLEQFNRVISTMPQEFQKVKELAPDQTASLKEIQRLVEEKFADMRQTIDLRRSKGLDAALHQILTDHGWDLTNRIRAAARDFRSVKIAAYQTDSAVISSLGNQILYVSLGGDLVLCVLLLLASISMHAGAVRREELIAALQEDDRRLRDLRQTAETAEERVRHILESIGDGFVAVDCDWKITYCNAEAAKLLGLPAAEMLSQSFWNQFPDAANPEVESSYRSAMEDQKQVSFERFIKSRNSYWEQSVYPARDGLSVYFRDVTERRRFEERTRHTQKLESLGVLAGGIAHDFNNLLTAILGSASLIQEELPLDSPVRPFADNVIHASERAGQLTRQMLAYSGRGRFIVEPIDLGVQIREITALLESSITAQVELVLDLNTEGILIEADGGQIQQLVMNLVINGAEAIGPLGGRVIVSTRIQEIDSQVITDNLAGDSLDPGTFILLQVHDTGAGMDESTLARIFDPFFTTKFTGRGLGLAAVLGIVRGHRGAIKVYSNPGKGTTFKVFFPVAKGQIIRELAAPVSDLRGTATILVVDDEAVVQKLARSTLERYGYDVLVASNGKEALEVLASSDDHISAVLLDMTMPVMGGEETLSKIKAMRPLIKVIASSGYNEIEAVRRFGEGIDGFLQKPYRASQLMEKVKFTLLAAQPPDRGTTQHSSRSVLSAAQGSEGDRKRR
jgi:PAS domain S-box-containing protein